MKRIATYHELLILRMFSDARQSYLKLKSKQTNLVLLRFKSSEDTTQLNNICLTGLQNRVDINNNKKVA